MILDLDLDTLYDTDTLTSLADADNARTELQRAGRAAPNGERYAVLGESTREESKRESQNGIMARQYIREDSI